MTRVERDIHINLVMRILDRAEAMCAKHNAPFNRMNAALDIERATQQYPLALQEWLSADDENFAHDFFGIRNHMDRETGKLANFFVPRFYRPRQK